MIWRQFIRGIVYGTLMALLVLALALLAACGREDDPEDITVKQDKKPIRVVVEKRVTEKTITYNNHYFYSSPSCGTPPITVQTNVNADGGNSSSGSTSGSSSESEGGVGGQSTSESNSSSDQTQNQDQTQRQQRQNK